MQLIKPPLDVQAFVRLVQCHMFSTGGDALIAISLAGSVFFSEDPNTARTRVALSLLLTVAPFALVAPFLGPAVDAVRGGRRVVLAVSAMLRAVLCILMLRVLDGALVYPLAFLSLVLSKTHAVAKSASVSGIVVDDSSFVRANSLLALSAVAAGFVVGAIGYALSAILGEAWVLYAASAAFAIAAVLSLDTLPAASESDGGAPLKRFRLNSRGDLKLGRIIIDSAIQMGLYRGIAGFLAFLIAFEFRREELPTWWFGLPIAASMCGSLLGNALAPRLKRHVSEERIFVTSGVFISTVSLALGFVDGVASCVLLALVVGFGAAAAKIAFDSVLQREAPAAVHGRSFARFEALFQIVWVIGALIPVVISISLGIGYCLIALLSTLAVLTRSISTRVY